MQIGFFEIEGWEKKIILKHFSEDQVFFYFEKLDSENLPRKIAFDIISVFVDSRVDKKVIDHFPRLKSISTRSTGYNHIDLKVCKKISVSNVPAYGRRTVAEFTFGLLLSLTRKIYLAADQIKETGSFSKHGLRGIDLTGKKLGIIGTGKIGKEVIKIAQGFDMEVIATDPYPDLDFQEEYNFEYVSLEYLLKRSDVISVHCPLNAQTKHLINKKNIGLIKKGAYLINTARGEVTENEALVLALKQGILAGVGLDVLEAEGEIKDELNLLTKDHPKEAILKDILYNHILMKMPNVIITPHNAFNSQEALERLLQRSIENIKSVISGNPVNLVRG